MWAWKGARKRPNFRLQRACNSCGGWGHVQAECQSVLRMYAVDPAGADFQLGAASQVEPETLAVGGIP